MQHCAGSDGGMEHVVDASSAIDGTPIAELGSFPLLLLLALASRRRRAWLRSTRASGSGGGRPL